MSEVIRFSSLNSIPARCFTLECPLFFCAKSAVLLRAIVCVCVCDGVGERKSCKEVLELISESPGGTLCTGRPGLT